MEKIPAARDQELDIHADQYPYVAGGTALAASLPPWVADGGSNRLLERLRDPNTRERIKGEMLADDSNWENLYVDCGGGSGIMIAGIVNRDLKQYNGTMVSEMAAAEHKAEIDALFDFILADPAQTGALYFMASEQDLLYG